jgi:dihydroorotase
MNYTIQNARVLDPASGYDQKADLWIEDGVIAAIQAPGSHCPEGFQRINTEGYWVMPGFIDLHVHFRDPGFLEKEDIESGIRAAAKGGYTTVCCMPNTLPPLDHPDRLDYVTQKAQDVGGVNVLPVAAITKGQLGKELVDMKELAKHGACAFSEDGKTVADVNLMRQSMEEVRDLGLTIFSHTEEVSLAGGVMNLGPRSFALGVAGIPAEAEELIVARDILLAKNTGCKLHLCHISTRGSLDLIRLGKQWGLSLTAETAPHYFALTSEAVRVEDGFFKMNPPLREEADVAAIKSALKDGTLDAIATDHAPHRTEEKEISLDQAAFGVIGLETAFAISYTQLVLKGPLTPLELVEKMSTKPAEILGIDRGTIAPGKAADLTVVDVRSSFSINPESFASKSRNTPFDGKEVYGKIKATMVQGGIVYHDGLFD